MDRTVEVAIPIDESVACELDHAAKREAVGRLVSRVLHRRRQTTARLLAAMDRLAIDARSRGLTDEIVEAELAAYNAERRG